MNRNLVYSTLFALFALLLILLAGCNKGGTEQNINPPGAKWVRINHSNSRLSSDNLNTVFVDFEGGVWFGSDSGVSYLKNSVWTNFRDSLMFFTGGSGGSGYGATVNTITQDKDGPIWIGLKGGGIVRYNRNATKTVWTHFKAPVIPFDNVNSMSAELISRGDVWITTGVLGAARYAPSSTPEEGTWTIYNASNSTLSNQLSASAISPLDNTFWIGSHDAGVYSYDQNHDAWVPFPLPPEYAREIRSMALDLNGLLWCAKSDSGISVLEVSTGIWRHHYTVNNMAGLFPRGPFRAVTTDLRKHRWFGTDDGLIELNDTVWTMHSFRDNPIIPNDPITGLAYDRKNNLWITTMDSGAVVFNPDGTQF